MTSAAVDFEQAITLAGYGRFHYILVACCALSLLAVGFQNGLNAYVLPVAQCDLQLNSAHMGYLNISFLIGGICSAFLWGLLGDLIGRNKVLMFTLLCDWVATVCAGLSQTFYELVVFRFMSGFLIGAPGTLMYSYCAEFQPARLRTKVICFIGMFFTIAWLVLPVLAWIIMPLPWEIRLSGFIFNSWKLFIIIVSIPSFITGFWLHYLPESPKFLLSRGDSKQALLILQYIFSVNTGQPTENFQVKKLMDDVSLKQVLNKDSSMKVVGRGRTARLIRQAGEQMKRLFRPPLLAMTVLTSLMLFTNLFGYLGLGVWLPEILNRFEEFSSLYPGEKITLCELQSIHESKSVPLINNDTSRPSSNLTEHITIGEASVRCENSMDDTVFMNTIIMGASCLIGNVISVYLAGLLNRKVLPVATMLIGGVSAAGIYWLNTSTQHLIVASLFQASMATANIVLNGVVVELFPTAVSAMAVCTATLAGRLGAVVSNLVLGLLLDVSCGIPLLIIVITLLAGASLGLLIPSDKTLTENEKQLGESYNSVSDISTIS